MRTNAGLLARRNSAVVRGIGQGQGPGAERSPHPSRDHAGQPHHLARHPRQIVPPTEPAMFVGLAGGVRGRRLTVRGLYHVIVELGAAVGLRTRPHGLRHASITAALDANNDVRAAQLHARHADPQTTMRYDDKPPGSGRPGSGQPGQCALNRRGMGKTTRTEVVKGGSGCGERASRRDIDLFGEVFSLNGAQIRHQITEAADVSDLKRIWPAAVATNDRRQRSRGLSTSAHSITEPAHVTSMPKAMA
jgi:hypothetical protein